MPTTVVDLCNMALAHLRQRPVTGDDNGAVGDTAEASNCRRFYDVALRESFRAFDWPFARQFIAGQKIAGAGVPNWKFAYEIPAGVEIVRHVVQNGRTEAPVQFRLMRTSVGGVNRKAVFTNEDAAWLSCTLYLTDPSEYPNDFVEFASLTLASHLAMPITGKAELMMGMRKLAEDAGKRAALAATNSETVDAGDGEDPNRQVPALQSQQLDIGNTALAMLGQEAMVTWGDRTKPADTVRRFFKQAVRASLRLFDWPFARAVVAGANVRASTIPNWAYAYDMPDCAAFRHVIRSADDEQPVRYQILRPGIGSLPLVYTNEPAALFVVTANVEDPAAWPQDFVQLVAASLAQLMALPMTGKAEVLKAMADAAEMSGKMAITAAGTEEGEQEGADASRDTLPVNSVPVEVANLALGLIGQDAITSFGERTKRANAARRFYALALRATLRGVDWPFARVYAAAVPSAAALIPGHAFAYQYPPNATCVRGFAKDYPTQYDVRFTLANGSVFTRRPAGTLIYTRWDVDPAQYDPEFTLLLAHELAALIAAPLTGKGDATVAMRAAAKMLRDKARADAANEDMGELDERVPDWLAARGIPSLVRQDREELMRTWGGPGRSLPPWGALPGSPQVNPNPPMITGPGPGSSVLPAYIPGLTAPVEPTPQLLSSSDFWVESVGGRLERDGRLVVDDPSQHYVEPEYDIQEDN